MGRSHESMSRREILKRGAIVGGGVLWVTPVVQTLGMGSAFAAPVSDGASRCTMSLEITTPCWQTSSGYGVFFGVFVPPECKCNPLPADHAIHLAVVNKNYSVKMDVDPDRPAGWYRLGLGLKTGDIVEVRCVRVGTSFVPVDYGERLTFTGCP